MALTIVTEPTIEPLTLEEIEDHLRLSETSTGEEDAVLLFFLESARRYAERVQNRAYLEQVWTLTLDTWPNSEYIEIPRPPLMGVSSVVYYATGGTAATMTAGNYYVDTASEPGRVHLEYGETWPSETLRPANGVAVTFTAGYGSVATAVPSEIKQALKLLIGHMYENREAMTTQRFGGQMGALPHGVDALLTLDRIWPV